MRTARRGWLVGLAAAACLVAGALPASAAPGDGSAFGVSVSVSLLGSPPVTAGPFAASNTNGPTSNTLVGAAVPGVVSTGVINTSALRDDVTGEVNSRASTADLAVGLLPLNPISATAVEATCTAVQGGNSGATTLAGANLGPLGPISATPAPNTVINVPGPLPGTTIVSITFNEQINNPDDGSLTVNAIHIRLLGGVLGSIGTGDVIISQARCGPAALPIPMASGSGLWISLGLIGMAVVPAAIVVTRRRQAAVQTV